jgi:Spy/CpxP family protein refolding chaperone
MVGHTWFRRVAALLGAGALCLTLAAPLAHPAAAAPQAARAGKKPGHGQGRKLTAALEKLNLSEDQKVRLRGIQARYQEQFQELRRSAIRRARAQGEA